MRKRHYLLLSLLYANDQESIDGRTRLQKLLFLMQQNMSKVDNNVQTYEFIPYDYGPFSKDLYTDLDQLEHGYIEEHHEEFEDGGEIYRYEMTEDARAIFEQELTEDDVQYLLNLARDIKHEYNDKKLSDLIEEVYSQYPDFAKNSIY